MSETAQEPLRLDDLAAPNLTELQRAAMAAAEAQPVIFTVEAILAEAVRQTGLTDFGEPDFRKRLVVWTAAAEADRELSALGRAAIHGDMVRLAVARLRFEALCREQPEAGRHPVKTPLVIAGLPRSGTTHLLTLLSGDPRLRSLPYWEAIRPIPADDGNDERRALAEVEWQQRDSLLPHWKAIHEFSPDHISEDVELQSMDFGSYYLEWLCEAPAWRDYYFAHDQVSVYRYLKRVLGALSWLKGPDRWVTKCPQHMEQLPAVAAVFPDATTIITHRDPIASIQSAITAVCYISRVMRTRVDPPAVARYWIDRYERLLRACVRDRDRLPPERSLDVYFDAFMADPHATLEAIYDKAGLSLEPEVRAQIEAVMNANERGRHGRLVYDLRGQFGIDPTRLRERFAFYLERFPVRVEVE